MKGLGPSLKVAFSFQILRVDSFHGRVSTRSPSNPRISGFFESLNPEHSKLKPSTLNPTPMSAKEYRARVTAAKVMGHLKAKALKTQPSEQEGFGLRGPKPKPREAPIIHHRRSHGILAP